jgi:hypothetical protein
MSEPISGFQRWALLMDRAARDEVLTPEEEAFCERFGRDNSAAECELSAYRELGDLDSQADDSRAVRTLVDGALSRLEAEDAERAVAEGRRFQLPAAPFWLVASGVGVALLAAGLLNRGEPAASPKSAPSVETASSRPLTRAELVYASGQVNVEGKRATAGRVLLGEGTRIETGDGVACVLVDSDINLCLAAHSDMRLAALYTPQRRVELGAGVLATRLSTQPEGQSLTIAAGDVTSTAVGTAFAVERQPGRAVVTTVMNGKVRVVHGSAERMVNAHERAHSGQNQVQVNTVSRNEEASSWALLGPTMLWHDPVSATLELTGEPAAAEAFLDGQPIGRAPLSTLVPVGGHRLIVRNDTSTLLDEELHWNAGETRSLVYRVETRAEVASPREMRRHGRKSTARKARTELNAKVAAESAPAQPVQPVIDEPIAPQSDGRPTPAELLRSARRQVRDTQLRAAVSTYESLRQTYPDSEEAHTVLVSLAQLELSAMHNPTRSLQHLDAYLARGGTLSEEARLTRIHALRALHRSQEEAAAISEFLVKHPRSFEDSTLRARLADLRNPR